MDAFAVALATGACLDRPSLAQTARMAVAFGVFQALMPVLGWLLGLSFKEYIESFDHWVAFAMLAFVGGKMLYECFSDGGEEGACRPKDPTRGLQLLLLAIATSLDAMAVGLSFSLLGEPIVFPAVVIGLVCLALTAFGVLLGHSFKRFRLVGRYAELAGGLVLIGIGLKILQEHGAIALL
ncbi:MAG: manganese efflux pump MntP family protein [Desulfovibrio sp.]|nr:manganese efflux pump MntP family protein [Desulfovibrio sp.]